MCVCVFEKERDKKKPEHLALTTSIPLLLFTDFPRQHGPGRGGSEPHPTAGFGPLRPDPTADLEKRHRPALRTLRMPDHRSAPPDCLSGSYLFKESGLRKMSFERGDEGEGKIQSIFLCFTPVIYGSELSMLWSE